MTQIIYEIYYTVSSIKIARFNNKSEAQQAQDFLNRKSRKENNKFYSDFYIRTVEIFETFEEYKNKVNKNGHIEYIT